jgi:hypothetical protein
MHLIGPRNRNSGIKARIPEFGEAWKLGPEFLLVRSLVRCLLTVALDEHGDG